MKKILIIHNIAWSHYKAAVFSKLYKLTKEEGICLKVIQVAISEKGRKKLGDIDLSLHQYPCKILFNSNYEDTSFIHRTIAIIKEIKEYEPDLVVVPGVFDIAYWFALFYLKIKKKKVITGFDSTEADHKRIWIKEEIKKIFIRLCDGAFCYGTKSKEYAVKLGIDEENAFIGCQAVNNETILRIYTEKYKQKEEFKEINKISKNYNFIFVGRLSPVKNITTLISAFGNIKHIEPKANEWGLIIVGDGPQRDEIKALVKKLDLEKDVFFTGGKSWREVPEYYALADVFVLPSISEPWGLVVNEAMVCGLPVIVSKRAGSYWDLVKEGVNGFGFDPYNQEELEQIMLKFIRGEVDRKQMGEESKDIIKDYTPENVAKQMLYGIKKVLGIE
jgi:glycosyltransferase involved in cell wall biosynthesis